MEFYEKSNKIKKYYLMLLIGMALISGRILVNRYLVEIPEILSILISITASILMLIGIYYLAGDIKRKEKK